MAKYISASQAARMLNMSEKTIRGYVSAGKLHAVHISKTRYGISLDDIKHLADTRGIELEPPGDDRLARLEREVNEQRLAMASLDLELIKLRERVAQLEQRLERSERTVERPRH